MNEAGGYRTIVADPPWPISDFPQWFASDKKGAVPRPYDVMSVEEISRLPVRDLADNVDGPAHLYLWAIDSLLEEAFSVVRSWGFSHSATLVWCKPQQPNGLGGTFPSNIEHVLYCRREGLGYRPAVAEITARINDARKEAGLTLRQLESHGFTEGQIVHWTRSSASVRLQVPSVEQWDRLKNVLPLGDDLDGLVRSENEAKGVRGVRAQGRWFTWPRGEHSQKPEAFLDLVESVSPGPYLELFARRQRLGWDTWGDEAFNHVEMAS